MKQFYFLILFAFLTYQSNGQQVFDFESPESSIYFQYFGSSLEPMLTTSIVNPDPTGINTSANVGKYIKASGAQTWAGGFANPAPNVPIDGSDGGSICVKVWMDHVGVLALKLEGVIGGGENWITTQPYTTPNAWQELCFDLSVPSLEDSKLPGTGKVFGQIVLFFDFGTAGGATNQTYYFDDIKSPEAEIKETVIIDFESDSLSGAFSYFGSGLEGTKTTIIANPNKTGIDTSSMVGSFIKPAVAMVWAGAYSNPNPTIPVDLSNGGKICIKVHMDHIGNLALKLEGSISGAPNWIQQVSNTKINEWEELCFDVSLPSLEAPNTPAAKSVFKTVVLFFDFGKDGTGTDVTYLFDDIKVKSGGQAPDRIVSFKVDMNAYSGNFDQVYISGNFNNWSGDANPLSDSDFDGIWEGEIKVKNGTYEYKITLDNWAKEEKFLGTESCTKTSESGEFTNRLLLVGADAAIPKFCFNSCYACGEEVKITFKLGMGNVTPSPDGVWLSGGGNFDVPGGRYKMKDVNNNKIYELVVPRKRGFESFFTFANGPCADYSCKEDLTGKSCANPSNFNDRKLLPVMADTVYASCFGLCSKDALCTPSSTKELQYSNNLFEILGNPSSGNLVTLAFNNAVAENKEILLMDNMGVNILTLKDQIENQVILETQSLKAGIYFVVVKSGKKTQTKKLIVI